jgi:tRNA(adenine34) deaminase
MATRAEHETYMRVALAEAQRAARIGEVPVGALLVGENELRARAFNQPIAAHDPAAHAEVLALREAGRVSGNYRLPNSTLYVTLEPCLMCVGALVNARVATLVYGAPEPKFGAVRSLVRALELPLNHKVEVVSGILADECRELVQAFFRERRDRG